MTPCEKDLLNNLTKLTAEVKAFKELMDERHKHFDALAIAAKEAIAVALLTVNAATLETKLTFQQYKKDNNEWHMAMTAREARFAAASDLAAVEKRVTTMEASGQGMSKLYGWIVAGLTIIIGTAALYFK